MLYSSIKPAAKLSSIRSENLAVKQFNEIAQTSNTLPIKSTIAKIEQLEELMLQQPQADMPPNHYFGDDVYVRELFFKRGTIATGRVQRVRHVSIMLSGHMTIWTPTKGIHEVRGPEVTEVEPGMKRVGFAHTDVHWLCAYGVRDQEQYSADELLDFLTFRYYGEYLDFINEHTITI